MRAFVALEISEPKVLDALAAFQRELSRTGAGLKLVERENLHFTVKFLGEVSESQAKEADARLKRLRLSSVQVEVKGVGAFPSISRPSVIWVGVPGSQEGLVDEIAQSAIEALEGIGETDRRPFRAHATLARLRSRRGTMELASFLSANSDRDFGPLALRQLKLKSSVLSPSGPTYSDVGVYPLD